MTCNSVRSWASSRLPLWSCLCVDNVQISSSWATFLRQPKLKSWIRPVRYNRPCFHARVLLVLPRTLTHGAAVPEPLPWEKTSCDKRAPPLLKFPFCQDLWPVLTLWLCIYIIKYSTFRYCAKFLIWFGSFFSYFSFFCVGVENLDKSKEEVKYNFIEESETNQVLSSSIKATDLQVEH